MELEYLTRCHKANSEVFLELDPRVFMVRDHNLNHSTHVLSTFC